MTKKTLFLLILASGTCFFTEFQSACGAELQILHGHVPALSKGLTGTGSLPGSQHLKLAIALPLRNKEALTNLLRDIYNPASPNFRHYLTPEQFTAQFGPTESDFQAVAAFAKASGFTITELHRNRLLVDVDASVADIEKAFHLKMRTYTHPSEKRIFYAPDSEPSLALSVPLAHISGLDSATLPKPRYHLTSPNAAPSSGSGVSGTYAGSDFRAAYVPDTTLTGAGQTVGLLQFDGYSAVDIASYENAHGLPNVTLTNVLLDGFSGAPTGDGGEVEVSLDIEMSMSMAPGLSEIIVYEAGPYGNWHDVLNRMANDNLARQLSCSWYIPGGPSDPVADGIFQEMALQGQSFYAACGDYDAYTGLIPFPGDTPYITEVGGTTLTTTGPATPRVSETVWNWGGGIGTGGGISTQYPIPSYQTNINMSANQGSTTMRNIPDIALTADNVDVRADGSDFSVGGTSCASPLWAGFTALVNQQAAASGRLPVGFINPALDAIGTGAIYGLCFNDITNGNNTSSSSPTKFYATSGFDLCTGWGTPAGQKLINALANPEPLLILPFQGFAAYGGAGGPFTISSESLTLTNTGTNALNWIVTNSAAWLTVTPASGSLTPGGPATIVTVSLNAAASNLMVGAYTTTLWFTNLNDNIGQSLQYSLNIILPPMITNQPSDQPVLDGQTAVFSAGVTGGLPLTYQWELNGTNLTDGGNISGSATNVLTINNASATNAGTYILVVTNAAGTAISSNAVLSITPSAPVVTQQPADQTIYVSFSAQFSVAAVGTKPFFYQWTLNSTNVNGATNASLYLTDVQLSQAGNYAAIISNSIGSTLSSNALLTVNPLPPCDPLPSGAVSWWQAEGNALDSLGGNNGTLTGGVTYALGEVGQGAFVFPGNNSGVELGSPTNLWLQDFTIEMWLRRASSSIVSSNNPSESELFSFGPNGYGFGLNNNGTLFLTQVGDNNVTVQTSVTNTAWHHIAVTKVGTNVVFYDDGVAYPAPPYNPGFQFDTPVAIGARGDDLSSSFYGSIDELTVYNRALSASEIQLIYSVAQGGKCPLPPSIVSPPASQAAYVGNNVVFSISISGSPPLFYEWFFNGTNAIAGATNASLTLTNVQMNQAGAYSVLLSNYVSSVLSSNAVLTVDPVPSCAPPDASIVSWWQAESNALDSASGNSGTLTGGVTYGPGEVGLAFMLPGNSSAVQLGNPASLQLQNFTIEMWLQRASSAIVSSNSTSQAELFCYGDNGYGFGMLSNGNLFLTQVDVNNVIVPTTVTDTNWHHLAVTKDGTTVVFYVDGVAYPTPAYNADYTFDTPVAIGARGDDLSVSFYGSIDEVAVYNQALTALQIQLIYAVGAGGKCPLPPSITSQPVNDSVYVGNTATFAVSTTGSPPLAYQWLFDSTNMIAGATNASLTLTNLQLNQGGTYSVLVSNAVASVPSSNAMLTVSPLPPCQPVPSGLMSWWQGQGNALDSTGANNGTLTGVTFGPGEVGQGFVFSGNGSGVQVGFATNLELQNFTIEMWLQRASTSIISSNNPIESELFCCGIGGYGFGLDNDGTLFLTEVGTSVISVSTPVIDLNWHHVAVTKNGTAVVFYVDGIAYPAGSFSATFTFGTLFGIGARGDNLSSSFYGSIDEPSVYNRALSASELQFIYEAGGEGKCPLPPAIITQPVNDSVYVGNTATFTVSANGSPPLAYQWLFDSTNMIAGATNASLTLTNIQMNQAGTYSVLVSNSVTSILSSNALLTVNPLPSCDPAPSGLAAWWQAEGNAADVVGLDNGMLTGVTFGPGEVGQSFVFSGNGSGVQLGIATNLELQNFTIEMWLQRASTTMISLNNPSESELFACGNNGYGFGLDNNGTLFLTQIGDSVVTVLTPLTDLYWHHVAVTKNGTAVVFYVDGVAYPAPAYSASFNFGTPFAIGARGDNLASSFYGSIDETAVYNRALSAPEIQAIYNAADAGKCPQAPLAVMQPTNQAAYVGSTVTFAASFSGTQPLEYQWYFNTFTAISGATNATLTLSNLLFVNAGDYQVFAGNGAGGANSSNAVLSVDPATLCDPPASGIVSWWTGNGNALDAAGNNNGTLASGATYGPGEVNQAFAFNGNGGAVQLGNPASLQLQNFTIEMWIKRASSSVVSSNYPGDGELFCYGPGGYGFGINANSMPFLTEVGVNNVTITNTVTDTNWHHLAVTKNGTSVVFYIDGGPHPVPAYSANYSFSTQVAIGSRGDDLEDSFLGSIDEPAIYSQALSAAQILAIYQAGSNGKCPPPVGIAVQPVSQLTMPGCNATLSVVASGGSPFSYQWWQNGVSLPGQANSSISFNNLQSSNFGTYFVIVSNPFGSAVSSSNAVLAQDHVPVANPAVLGRYTSGGFKVPVSALLANDTDADGDPLTIIGVSPNSFANGTLSLQGNWIYYTPPSNNTNSDIFTYTVSDGHCDGTSTGFVSVETQSTNTDSGRYIIQTQAGGAVSLNYYGAIPGTTYRIQYTPSLLNPDWQDLSTNTADAFGGFEFVDSSPTNAPERYYRAVTP